MSHHMGDCVGEPLFYRHSDQIFPLFISLMGGVNCDAIINRKLVAPAGCCSIAFSVILNALIKIFDTHFWHCLLDRSLAIETVTLTEET